MGKKNRKKNGVLRLTADTADKHVLYEASVQSPDFCLGFSRRTFRRLRKRPMLTLREDFCGTAALSCEWAKRGRDHVAYGVDLDQPTLDWCKQNHFPRIGEKAAARVKLVHGDVLTAKTPRVDAILAFNFSYYLFKTRDELRAYFEAARRHLKRDGVLFLDIFGGPESMCAEKEKRKIRDGLTPDGRGLEPFTYIWDQASYNHINHDVLCHIHFKFRDGTRIKNAFTYDWRLWTPPEIQEVLLEAGYKDSHVYMQGWDDEADDTDNIFRRRTVYDDMGAWIGYMAAVK